MRRWLTLSLPLLLGTAACDASFVDLRDEIPDPNAAPVVINPDAGVASGPTDGGVTAGGELDAGTPPPPPPGQDTVVASGSWEGRSDYTASGTAELVQLANGSFEVRFSEDFSVSGVPGPVVVLSRRASIGRAIDPSQGDVELGPQARRSGAQTYVIPAGADDRAFVWIYCAPFGIEVARAPLNR